MNRAGSEILKTSLDVLREEESFWSFNRDSSVSGLLRYSFFLGFFPFAGYLVNYTIRGTIWNVWPFVQTTLDVGSGLVFAGLQWIFFSTFPIISALLMEIMTSRSNRHVEFEDAITITTYSITPLCLSLLFAGVPYFDRVLTTLGFATFLYLLYYGFRISLKFRILRCILMTVCVFVLFALIRQMFVFAIGY